MSTIPELFALAVQQHQAGKLPRAEQLYQQVLTLDPQHIETLHLFGLVAHQLGKHEAAIERIQQAISLQPLCAAFHSNLGEIYRTVGKNDEALAACQRAIELDPHDATGFNNLASVLNVLGRSRDAADASRQAIRLNPQLATAYQNLGIALRDQGRLQEAMTAYQQAIARNPDFYQAYSNLAEVLTKVGRFEDAINACRRAIDLQPKYGAAYTNLAAAFTEQGKLDEAITTARQGIGLDPQNARAYLCLGNAFSDQGNLDAAITSFAYAIAISPRDPAPYLNLGNAFKDQGRLEEAVERYQQAMELRPSFQSYSNLLYSIHFCDRFDAQAIYDIHRRWDDEFGKPLLSHVPLLNDRNSNRPLRIGYVSPDFRLHPVGRFLLPLMESHDHSQVQVYCYSSVIRPDEVTSQIRQHVDVWRDVADLSDEQVVELIRQDAIDILVDLSMHMADNRLAIFARKPAPVQVTYLAYVGTTGLSAMDYRLTDSYLDPAAEVAKHYSETSITLPETYWCYRPGIETPAVDDLPANLTGHITFGALNNFCKVSQRTLETWGRLLKNVPQARLILHARNGSHRERVLHMLGQHGVDRERVTFVGVVSMAEYFRLYQQIDIALDPFPYGGGTTTCDALWMGVPVVTLAGKTAVGRGGVSILSNLGLREWVANNPEEYLQIAAKLANDRSALSGLRNSLRQRLEASPLMDAPRFARHVEAAYREMWRRFCGKS